MHDILGFMKGRRTVLSGAPGSSRGFTLVETMVAVSIVAVSIVGPLYSLQKGVVASYAARDRLIATSLAQEGLEYVRAIRDANYLFTIANPSIPRTWLFRLDGSTSNGASSVNCSDGARCIVDMYNDTVSLCSGTCPPMRLSAATNIYNTQAVSSNNYASRFTRSISVTTINIREVRVTSTVTWQTGQKNYTITSSENLQNWL